MSTWSDLVDKPDTQERDLRYLRLDNPEKVGDTQEVNLRVLDEVPVQVWRHWFDNKPLNCAGKGMCPACHARQKAKNEGDPNWKELYRLDGKYLINVAIPSAESGKLEVKIWSFGSKLLGRIALYTKRKELGDPRDYDMTLIKRRTGLAKMNVEYDLLPSGKTGFTKEYKDLLKDRHDLTEEIKPSTADVINEQVKLSNALNPSVNGRQATILQVAELTELARGKGFTLEQLGVNAESLSHEQAEKYILDLKT